jgi:hypothetical protein
MNNLVIKNEIKLSDEITANLISVKEFQGGGQLLFRFENGFGASVVRHLYSYGGKEGLFELAVAKFKNDDSDYWDFDYNNNVSDGDVLGYLKGSEIEGLLEQIKKL